MKMVKIPLVSLETSAEYFRNEEQRYAEMGKSFLEMRYWADGMARAYERLIETYGQDN